MAGERWAGVGYNYEITWLSSSTLTYIADIKSQRQSLNTIKVFIVFRVPPTGGFPHTSYFQTTLGIFERDFISVFLFDM